LSVGRMYKPNMKTELYYSEWDSRTDSKLRQQRTKDSDLTTSSSFTEHPGKGQRRKGSNASTIQSLRATLAAQRVQADSERQEDKASKKRWWCKFSLASFKITPAMELKDVNFQDLTYKKYGGTVTWHELTVNDQVELIKEALKSKTFLIDPNSEYMKYWDVVVVLCLVFTAVVTPFEIAFLKPGYDTLYVVNRFVDLVFVKDMLMQFLLQVKKRTKQGTVWIRNRKKIAETYVKSWFIVDLLCIIPYDDITNLMFTGKDDTVDLGKLKVFRLLRVTRLFKLTRILKASRVVKRWENRMSFTTAKLYLIKFALLIIVSCHWMACVWGFFGIFEGSNLQCRNDLKATDPRLAAYPERKYFFKDNSDTEPFNPDLWDGQSWVVSFAGGRAAESPTNPCNADTLYVASIYWAVMTITSIGYGDIVPVTYLEYIACSICMMLSSILWAYIIGAACAVMSKLDPEQTEFEQRMDAFNAMAQDQDLPIQIRYRGREYIREARAHTKYLRNQAAAQSLSNDLRGTVARQMAKHYLDKIWFFENTSAQFREDTANKFTPHFYERREIVDHLGRLCVVERGAVGRSGRILVPWSFWGEDMLIRLESLRYKNCSISLAFSEIMTLSREDLSTVLVDYEDELKMFRRAAVRVALTRAVAIYKEETASRRKTSDSTWVLSLFNNCKETAQTGKVKVKPKQGQMPAIGDIQPTLQEQLNEILRILKKADAQSSTTQLEDKLETIQGQLDRLELSVTSMARAPPTIVDLTRLKQTIDPVREQCRQSAAIELPGVNQAKVVLTEDKHVEHFYPMGNRNSITNAHASTHQDGALEFTCCVSQAAAGRRGFQISTQ